EIAHLAGRLRHPRNLLRDARQRLDETSGALAVSIGRILHDARRELGGLASHVRPPVAEAREMRLHTSRIALQLAHAMETRTLGVRRAQLAALATRLDSISPLRCLERGYAIVTNANDGRAVVDAATVNVGDELDIRLRRGRLRAETRSRQV